MNEKTKQSLDTAKAENGSLISKQDFINAVKDVFSPKSPLPKSEPAPEEFDNPYIAYEIGQDPHTRWDANPFRVLLQWFGVDDTHGYIVLFNHLFGNGGTAKDLKDIFKQVKKEDYFLVGIPQKASNPDSYLPRGKLKTRKPKKETLYARRSNNNLRTPTPNIPRHARYH